MAILDLIYLVRGNLWRRKTRVLMTLGGVLIGSTTIILLVALGLGMQKNMTESLGKIGDLTTMTVQVPPECTLPPQQRPQQCKNAILNDELIEKIRQTPQVRGVAAQVFLKGSPTYLRFQNMETNVVVMGVEPALLPSLGYPLGRGELKISANQVVVGPKVAEYMFDLRMKQPVTPDLDLLGAWVDLNIQRTAHGEEAGMLAQNEVRRLRVQVAGVLAETGGASDYVIYYPINEVERWNRWLMGRPIRREVEGYDQIVVKMADTRSSASLDAALTSAGYSISTARKIIEQFNRFFMSLQLMLGGIGGVALLISAFGISNTMIMAIYERTREIGLLKSLGAKNGDILILFLAEAAALGLLGGALGAGLAVGLGELANHSRSNWFAQFNGLMSPTGTGMGGMVEVAMLVIPEWLVIFAIAFTTLTGVLAGIYPALRAASMQPLDALRHE
ncbi:MAG: ABC transporter permease [Bellilinea sp.]